MNTIGVYELKAHLSGVIDRVMAGEELEVTRRGRACIRLTPLPPQDEPTPGEKDREREHRVRELMEGFAALKKVPGLTGDMIQAELDEQRERGYEGLP